MIEDKAMERHFIVIYEVEIDAETADEAARMAVLGMLNGEHFPMHFQVRCEADGRGYAYDDYVAVEADPRNS